MTSEPPFEPERIIAALNRGTVRYVVVGGLASAALRELPVDVLKVPKPFVDGRGSVRHDRALLTMLVQLGALFGLQVVAEGVERADQRELLRELGCELGQGYLLGRPMPFEALAERLPGARRVLVGAA